MLRQAILEQELKAGERLPATRELATQLSLSRNTVNSAYQMLLDEGYLLSRSGSGYYVAEVVAPLTKPPAISATALSHRGQTIARPARAVSKTPNPAFQPGLPDLSAFPFAQWQRCAPTLKAQPQLLRYHDDGGYGPLKTALQHYLRQSRGVHCEEEQIVLVNGSQAALDLLARLLTDPGDLIAIEEPGYLGAREAFLGASANLEPIAVDEEGLSVTQLSASQAKLVYTTPSYQFPLGKTMSLTRRQQLLHWASDNNGFIIEDDYDSEFRYSGHPLSSLQGLDTEGRVIYLGTFSKVLFPGIRLGYLILPGKLAMQCAQALRTTGQDAPLLLQAQAARFIEDGHFAAHLRKMRKLYSEKQSVFVALCEQYLKPWLNVQATHAGMQVPSEFCQTVDEAALIYHAQKAGLVLSLLSRYYFSAPQQRGLYLGYAGVPTDQMENSVQQLQDCFDAIPPVPAEY